MPMVPGVARQPRAGCPPTWASGLLHGSPCLSWHLGAQVCRKHDPISPSQKVTISIRTPDTRNLISPCENAWSYLQIRCKPCRAGGCGPVLLAKKQSLAEVRFHVLHSLAQRRLSQVTCDCRLAQALR